MAGKPAAFAQGMVAGMAIDPVTRDMRNHSESAGESCVLHALKLRIALIAICLDSHEIRVLD